MCGQQTGPGCRGPQHLTNRLTDGPKPFRVTPVLPSLRLSARVHHLGGRLMRGERGSEGRKETEGKEGCESGDGASKLAERDVGMRGIKGRGGREGCEENGNEGNKSGGERGMRGE